MILIDSRTYDFEYRRMRPHRWTLRRGRTIWIWFPLACFLPFMCSAADEEFIAPPVTGHVHASTLVALKDGGYFAAWFEGSKEGAQDVAIYGAARKRCIWSEKHVLAKVNPSSPHWNPVLRRVHAGRMDSLHRDEPIVARMPSRRGVRASCSCCRPCLVLSARSGACTFGTAVWRMRSARP